MIHVFQDTVFIVALVFLAMGIRYHVSKVGFGHDLKDEVNAVLPPLERYGLFTTQLQERQIIEQHRQMFPGSEKAAKAVRASRLEILFVVLGILLLLVCLLPEAGHIA